MRTRGDYLPDGLGKFLPAVADRGPGGKVSSAERCSGFRLVLDSLLVHMSASIAFLGGGCRGQELGQSAGGRQGKACRPSRRVPPKLSQAKRVDTVAIR